MKKFEKIAKLCRAKTASQTNSSSGPENLDFAKVRNPFETGVLANEFYTHLRSFDVRKGFHDVLEKKLFAEKERLGRTFSKWPNL